MCRSFFIMTFSLRSWPDYQTQKPIYEIFFILFKIFVKYLICPTISSQLSRLFEDKKMSFNWISILLY